MRKEIIIFFVVSAIIISLFLVFGDMVFMADWIREAQGRKTEVAFLSVIVLILDVFLPVPASIVMVLTGSILGFIPGFLINYIGILASNIVGFAAGRIWPEATSSKGTRWSEKSNSWLAIAATRGIPVLAESVAITAGAIKYPFRRYLYACLIGNLPFCVVYSLSGYYSFQEMELLWALGFNLVLIAAIYFLGKGLVGRMI